MLVWDAFTKKGPPFVTIWVGILMWTSFAVSYMRHRKIQPSLLLKLGAGFIFLVCTIPVAVTYADPPSYWAGAGAILLFGAAFVSVYMRRRNIHPDWPLLHADEVASQMRAEQPRLRLLLAAVILPAFGPTQMWRALRQWPYFAALVKSHPAASNYAFLTVQETLIASFLVWMFLRYSTALMRKTEVNLTPRIRYGWLVLSPLILFTLAQCAHEFHIFTSFAVLNPKTQEDTFIYVFNNIWSRMPYGASLSGVLCTSAAALTFPVLEEVCFTGFLANATIKRAGVPTAFALVPAICVLAHVPQYGFGTHLLPLWFAALSYLCARLLTGALWVPIGAHLLFNVLTLAPKCAVAVVYFAHN
jgi:membrane protease YdiL (CAAX protease family)